MLVLDVTSETSFDNVRNWMTDIDKHVEKASVQKILVGNKADVSAAAAEDTVCRVPIFFHCRSQPLTTGSCASYRYSTLAFALTPTCLAGGSSGDRGKGQGASK